jgi:hypothetical protein
MSAFNVVRFRVKPGLEDQFIAAHKDLGVEGFSGARRFSLVNTGNGGYCVIGEWNSFGDIVNARPKMIGLLDTFRHCLEELGADIGVTDPVSGEAVMDMGAPAAAPKARRSAGTKRKPANKARSTSARAGKPAKKPGKKKAAAKGARKPAKKPAKKSARKAAATRRR